MIPRNTLLTGIMTPFTHFDLSTHNNYHKHYKNTNKIKYTSIIHTTSNTHVHRPDTVASTTKL